MLAEHGATARAVAGLRNGRLLICCLLFMMAIVASRTRDRRVVRSRSALMRAAVALVGERGTTAVPIPDIAEAADVSRQLVYLHFGNREMLLLEAALDLARKELL